MKNILPTTIEEVITKAKPSASEKKFIAYQGKDRAQLNVKYFTLISLIARALNPADYKADYKKRDKRKYFPWFYINEKGGFVFNDATYAYLSVDYVAPAHAFHDQATAEYAGKTFLDIYEQYNKAR